MAKKLIFETGLDGSGFERGLAKLGATGAGSLKNFVAGAFGVYSIHQAIAKTVESAEELITTSKRLGVAPEQLQVLRQAARESSLEFGRLALAFDRINVAREKALSGDAKKMAAFARFGINATDLRTKTASDLFTHQMAAAARTSSAQDLAGPGAAIFGVRAFGALIPVLKTDFEDLQGKMEQLGSLMSTDAAVQIKVTADEFGLLSNIIVAQLAPALGMIAPALLKFWGALQTAGSYLVTQFGNQGDENDMSFRDWLLSVGAGLWDTVGVGTSDEAQAAQVKLGRKTMAAEGAAAETAAEQKKIQAAFAAEIEKMVATLKNPPKPEIAPGLKAAAKKPVHGKAPESDALLAVGNFLGAGSSLINSIAEQQLQVARQSLEEHKTTNDKLDELKDAIETTGGGDESDIP